MDVYRSDILEGILAISIFLELIEISPAQEWCWCYGWMVRLCKVGLVFIIFICFFFIMVDIKVDEMYLIPWFIALHVEDEGGVVRITPDWDELFKALEDMFERNKLQVTVMGGVL